MRYSTIAVALMMAALAAGCGEKPQTALYKDGSYRGKPDDRPWDNAPQTYGSAQWPKGNEQAWEHRIRDRAMTQNEYGRIGR